MTRHDPHHKNDDQRALARRIEARKKENKAKGVGMTDEEFARSTVENKDMRSNNSE
jgi:hypothetical protein